MSHGAALAVWISLGLIKCNFHFPLNFWFRLLQYKAEQDILIRENKALKQRLNRQQETIEVLQKSFNSQLKTNEAFNHFIKSQKQMNDKQNQVFEAQKKTNIDKEKNQSTP